MVVISKAPFEKLEAYRRRMGWTFKWVSSLNNEFNRDFQAAFTPEEVASKRAFYNFRVQDPRSTQREGVSVFYKDADRCVPHLLHLRTRNRAVQCRLQISRCGSEGTGRTGARTVLGKAARRILTIGLSSYRNVGYVTIAVALSLSDCAKTVRADSPMAIVRWR